MQLKLAEDMSFFAKSTGCNRCNSWREWWTPCWHRNAGRPAARQCHRPSRSRSWLPWCAAPGLVARCPSTGEPCSSTLQIAPCSVWVQGNEYMLSVATPLLPLPPFPLTGIVYANTSRGMRIRIGDIWIGSGRRVRVYAMCDQHQQTRCLETGHSKQSIS